jgi:polysaccharide export outer membrane protein
MNFRLLLTLGLASLLSASSAGAQANSPYGGQTAASPYGTQQTTMPYGGASSGASMRSTGQTGTASQNSAGASPAALGMTPHVDTTTVQSVGFDISSPPKLVVTTDHALLYPPVHDYVLQPGDLISINIFGEQEFIPGLRINSFGQADLPFLGDVRLAGLTTEEAQTKLVHLLSDGGYYVNPQVSIGILEGSGAMIAVTGDLRGIVPVFGSRRLIDVLAALGGLGSTSSHIITITRPGVSASIVVDLGQDPLNSPEADVPVLPGDIINVSRAGVVFVLGEFKNSGIYPLSGSGAVTLMQFTALTGGAAKAAKISDLRLVRTINGKRQFVVLDIKKILLGKAPDPILQPGDILYMPTSTIKDLLTNGSLGSVLSVVNLAILVAQFGH